MHIFNAEDLNTGMRDSTNGKSTVIGGVRFKELDLRNSTDSYQVTATTASDVAILTGSGNDTIDLSHASGMAFIDAGAGTNTITAGAGKESFSVDSTATQPFTQPYTLDSITGFHAGDALTFKGVTSLYETVRGNTVNYTAWNSAVPGSAVYASFVGVPVGALSVTQAGNSIMLHG
jgi:hypothetical protein